MSDNRNSPTCATAMVGLVDIAGIKVGETVVVWAAAGAVGSSVGQIARIKGCRAIGIAGGAEKCRHVVADLGFDDCIDYQVVSSSRHLPRRLRKASTSISTTWV